MLTTALLNRFQSGLQHAVVSTIALMELTVHPWREGEQIWHDNTRHCCCIFPTSIWLTSRDVARQVAQLRARYQVRPVRCAACRHGNQNDAEAYIMNDLKPARVANHIPIVLLDDFIEENS